MSFHSLFLRSRGPVKLENDYEFSIKTELVIE